jgi:hypothetical protein
VYEFSKGQSGESKDPYGARFRRVLDV